MNQPGRHIYPQSLAHIHQLLPTLKDAEMKAAEYILANPEKVINQTITELAEQTQVSESTIVRLSQRAGYKGFQALKIAIARDTVETSPTHLLYDAVTPSDDITTIKRKVFSTNIMTLSNNIELVDDGELEKAVEAIVRARRIELYGLGASAAVAFDAHHKFLRIGLPAFAMLDSNMQVMSASMLTPGDVAIGISHSGTLKDTVEAIKTANQTGATTICLTNFNKSPLAQESSIRLVTRTYTAATQGDILASRITQLVILDTLVVAAALRRYELFEQNLQKTNDATASRRY